MNFAGRLRKKYVKVHRKIRLRIETWIWFPKEAKVEFLFFGCAVHSVFHASHPMQHVTILGTVLIGGSFAFALRK